VPDRAELDGLADEHRERELHGEPDEDNCPHHCHGHITLLPQATVPCSKSPSPFKPKCLDSTKHEQDDKPLGIGCADVEHPRSANRKSNYRDSALTLACAVQVSEPAADSVLWLSVSVGSQQMQEYRAYIMGPDGHVQSRVDLQV
jgi:hypothetical protein